MYGQVYLGSDTLEGNWDLIVSNDTLLNLESAKIIYDHHNDYDRIYIEFIIVVGYWFTLQIIQNGKKNGMAKYINYKDKLTIGIIIKMTQCTLFRAFIRIKVSRIFSNKKWDIRWNIYYIL